MKVCGSLFRLFTCRSKLCYIKLFNQYLPEYTLSSMETTDTRTLYVFGSSVVDLPKGSVVLVFN